MALENAVTKGGNFNKTKKFERGGDTLKGYFQGVVERPINGKLAKVHTYLTAEGGVDVIGQTKILYAIEDNSITPGTYMEVTYTGEKKRNPKNGNETKQYSIRFDRSDVKIATPGVGWDGSEDDDEALIGTAGGGGGSKTPAAVQAMLAKNAR